MEVSDRIKELAIEMAELIGKTFTKPVEENALAHRRLKAIRKEIHASGFYVSYTININPLDLRNPKVEVTIGVPKKNLSPEDQKLYDAWFRKVNGIEPDKEE